MPKRPVKLDPILLDARNQLGRAGERLALAYLKHVGMKPLYQNFRGAHGGEVDIVARDGRELVFLEVKTRVDDHVARPADSVSAAKQRLISRGAREWLRLLAGSPVPCRFDVLEIVAPPGEPPRFQLLRAAFEAPAGAI